MTLEDVIAYYKNGNRACKELGLTRQNVTTWKKKGYIPAGVQLKIQKMTNGALKASITDINHWFK